jgi:hypothetical protein
MITKEKLLFELVNFSNIDNPLDATHFFNKYKLRGENISDYRRRIAQMVSDIQSDQIYNAQINKPFYLIFSSGKGYYIAKNRDDAIRGRDFYSARAKAILELTSKIDKMIRSAFPQSDEAQLELL